MQAVDREVGPEIGQRVALAICRAASGEQIYIPDRPGPPEILPGDTPRTLAARYNVHRSTAANWVRLFGR